MFISSGPRKTYNIWGHMRIITTWLCWRWNCNDIYWGTEHHQRNALVWLCLKIPRMWCLPRDDLGHEIYVNGDSNVGSLSSCYSNRWEQGLVSCNAQQTVKPCHTYWSSGERIEPRAQRLKCFLDGGGGDVPYELCSIYLTLDERSPCFSGDGMEMMTGEWRI